VAFSTLAGAKLDDEIPSDWSKEFEKIAREDPPHELYDKPTSDDETTLKEVRKTVRELQTNLALSIPLGGFDRGSDCFRMYEEL
jgi:hypothetical protein